MALSAQELAELHKRVQFAHSHGFSVAKAAEYIAELGGEDPPVGVAKHSAGHLLALTTKHVHVPSPVPTKPEVTKVVKPVVQTKPQVPVAAPASVAPASVQAAPVQAAPVAPPHVATTPEPAAPPAEHPETVEHDTSTPKVVEGD